MSKLLKMQPCDYNLFRVLLFAGSNHIIVARVPTVHRSTISAPTSPLE